MTKSLNFIEFIVFSIYRTKFQKYNVKLKKVNDFNNFYENKEKYKIYYEVTIN